MVCSFVRGKCGAVVGILGCSRNVNELSLAKLERNLSPLCTCVLNGFRSNNGARNNLNVGDK